MRRLPRSFNDRIGSRLNRIVTASGFVALLVILGVAFYAFKRLPTDSLGSNPTVRVASSSEMDAHSLLVRTTPDGSVMVVDGKLSPINSENFDQWLRDREIAHPQEVTVFLEVLPEMTAGDIADTIASLKKLGCSDFVLANPQ